MTEKILFITLSNIGDCILSLPVLDALKENFPRAEITVLSGPRPKEIFQDNPHIKKLIIFDKRSGIKEKIKLFNALRKERFDMIIDLRNSFLGAILPARHKISPFLGIPKHITHMRERHLFRLQSLNPEFKTPGGNRANSIYIKPEDEGYINNILKENNIKEGDTIIVVAPGARSHTKRWGQDKFMEVIPSLIREFGAKIILAGDKADAINNKYIAEHLGHQVLDLSARTNIAQLASLLKKSRLVITNDSAILHIAGYLGIPTLAIFGPTNEIKYGPWPGISSIVKKDIFCRPCEKAQCKFGTLKCLQLIGTEDVLKQARILLARTPVPTAYDQKKDFKRILIVRTDRIGDVLLSTPVIKAFRDNYPHAYIAMMASPYGKNVVEDNPYLDEVIVYDKDGKHKSWARSLKFARNLKKKRFDVAIILHPTNRVHLVTFFAGIPRRVGYDRKLSFLLTDRIKHTKQLGQKHELEYALDLARYLGIEPKDNNIFLSVKPAAEARVEELLKEEGIGKNDKLLAIHPAASCPSKVWPNERFAEVADRLIAKYGFKAVVVSGPRDLTLARNVIRHMRSPAVNLAGKTSVGELAALLKRCSLFISNDSGPVHIAAAVGAPVVSIFGRSQKGLSPLRWGPVGKKSMVLHKNVGCIECLAHNCVKGFACLKAITVDNVIEAADILLKG